MAGMLLMLWMVATVGCSMFPSAPTNVTDKDISYVLQHNSSSDVIMVKCPGTNYSYSGIPGTFKYEDELTNKTGFKESDDKQYVWMAWKKEDTSTSEFNVKCGSYIYKVTGTDNFKDLQWNININSTSTTKFLENVDSVSISDITGNPMEDKDKCGEQNNELKIISKDKDGKLSIVENNGFKDKRSKVIYYFFNENKIRDNTEILIPCGISEIYDSPPNIKIDGYKFVGASENNKIKMINSSKSNETKYFFKLEGENIKNFYLGEKVLIRKMIYRNGQAEIKDDRFIETSNISVTGHEILEISYKSLFRSRSYKDVKEIIFFGPVEKETTLEKKTVEISAMDTSYQPSCSFSEFDYAYLYQMKTDNDEIKMESLATDGAVFRDFTRSGDLVKYKSGDVDKMDWVCIYKTPNGKILVPFQLERAKQNTPLPENTTEPSPEGNPSFIIKLVERLGLPLFSGLMALVAGVVAVILSLIVYFSCRGKIRFYNAILNKRKKYPNISKFWINIKIETLSKFSNIASDDCYLPSKVRRIKMVKTVASDDAAVEYATNLFEDTLIGGEIKAYYINGVSPKRRYIISEGPCKETTEKFFMMLYMENIEVVVAIIDQDNNDTKKTKKNNFYWPDKTVLLGPLKVEPVNSTYSSPPSLMGYKFKMKIKNCSWKYVTIVHVPGWKEYDLPPTNFSIKNLYKTINDCAGNHNVLIHNTQAIDSRTFIVIYFACIYESLVNDRYFKDPIDALMKIREKCLGGQITPREFAFVIYSVVDRLFQHDYLMDEKPEISQFISDYNDFIQESKMTDVDDSNYLAQMMKFFAATNKWMMMDIIVQSQTVQTFDNNLLKSKCKRHLEVLKNETMKKIRYPDVYCLDKTAVCIWDKPKSDLKSFIHANEMSYEISDGKRRKLIMCQAPIPDTFDDMLDMIYRNKVGIIVLLVNPEECNGPTPNWSPYFPVKDDQISTNTYIVNKKSGKPVDEYNISETNYAVALKANTSSYSCFKIYHYVAWPNKCVPKSTKDVLELCKRVMKDGDSTRDIVIHCSAGIGRTGTFAYIMLLIDTVLCSGKFSPINSLDFLRRHRHRAVQTDAQFAFAIATVVEYFKKELKDINKKIVVDFEKMLNNLYK